MKNIFKTALMICIFAILIGSTCSAQKVQVNDKLGAAAINNQYNDLLSSLHRNYLKAGNIKLADSTEKYDCYAATISANNGIKYICNKAGYVDAVYVISKDIRTNKAEAFTMMVIITNHCDVNKAKLLAEKSVEGFKPYFWTCDEMNRTYGMTTKHSGNYISTMIYAWDN